MSKKSQYLWSLVSLTLVLTMAFSPILAAPVETIDAAPRSLQQEPTLPDRSTLVRTPDVEKVTEVPAEAVMEKIDPALREAAGAGGKELLSVYVSVTGDVGVSQYLTDVIERPAVFAGIRNIYGKVAASNLTKIAQQPNVLAIVAVGIEQEKPYYPEQDVAVNRAARLDALRANEVPFTEAASASGDVGARGWFDVQDGHKSSAAWEKGFTGDGVVVGVLDDGIDFAHPDLQGTYARVTDPGSPYYGWPMAFSYVSMLYFAQEVDFQDLGATGITQNWSGSRWADTQFTVESSPSFEGGEVTAMFQPLQSGTAYEYTLPETSVSGFYKFGSHPERNLRSLYGHDVAILVVDEHSAGDYDTVYVDLDNDKDFTDEKPVTKDSPEVYRDMDGDGYADISGGLLVWISDGDNVPPTADWLWGVQCGDEVGTLKACPDSGELLLFAGPFDGGYTHGTQCASNIAGQGVVNDGYTAQPFYEGGAVVGGAPDVGLMDFGNHYYTGTDEDEFLVAALGYDGIPDSGDEVQITSNSYGSFRQMWGGWGYFGRLITAINTSIAPSTVWLFSAGNEGPGYGPQEGDGGPTTIQVGSSTQYGSTNWDSIASADQIMHGDPNSFFSKGPNRDGSSGLDVLGNGGRGAGDEGLNYYGFNGATSWATWGGTSRSSPVAAGNLALVYQAYYERYGEWPTWAQAKALLKSGATNSVSSPFFQGGGVVNADRATDLAAGIYGVYATPDEWQVGDWQGVDYLNFANVAYAGETYTKTYEVTNPSGYDLSVDLSEGVMTLIDSAELEFTTSDESEESGFNFHTPDYLMEMDTDMIPEDAELMVVRYVHSYDTFDPVYDFTANPNSSWRFMVYNWTDMNGDGMLWEDADGNGVVNHTDSTMLDNDGFLRPDFANSEIQEGEYIRVDYEFGGLAVPIAIRDPLERMGDGYFFGFQHRYNDGSVPTTTIKIGVEFYQRADWEWLELSDSSLEIPAESTATFEATMSLPADVAPGAYEGVIFMNDPGDLFHDAHETAMPVVVNVIADLEDGGSITFGGGEMADTLYQNSYTHGMFNWYGGGWTGAGDWRHYFFNVDEADYANDNLLIHTSWGADYPTDINTWLLGPTADCASNGAPPCAWYAGAVGQPDPGIFGPYTLWPIAGSDTFQTGATYSFNTSTGGPDDWMMAPIGVPGLYEVALHNVLYDGEELAAPFEVNVGTLDFAASIAPELGEVELSSINAEVYTDTGSFDVEFTPSLELPDLHASLTGGLSTNQYGPFTNLVPDTGGCYSAWCAGNVYQPFMVTAEGATELYVLLEVPTNQDADLFLVYDSNNNGVPEEGVDAVVGSSGNAAGTDESITLANPALGRYFAAIDGYNMDPDSGVNLDLYYSVTAPGPLPTDPVEVFSDTVAIEQDETFDPTTASYSMTVTTNERAAALHVWLTQIPAGNDVDVYVSDDSGIVATAQTTGDADEHILITPMEGDYRFEANKDYTIWVHGFDVTGTINPHLRVQWDVLNIWLSATHPDVYANQIGPGEMVSVTVHFEKEGWDVGDPPLSGRFIAGPSVLPGAIDELITIERVAPPGPPAWNQDNLGVDYTVESARGPSPFVPWSFGGVPLSTALAGAGETLTWTLTLTNNDPFSVTLGAAAEVDNWGQWAFFGDPYFVQTFGSVVDAPTNGTCTYNPTWLWVELSATLDSGESVTCAWTATTDSAMEPLDDHLSFVWEFAQLGGDAIWGADAYYRSFRTTGSYKMSDPGMVAPGDTFSYMISLANPSAVDREVLVYDELPAEVEFVSASNGMVYDAGTHSLSWSGLLAGTTLSTVDFEVEVTMGADVPEGTVVHNTANVYGKFMSDWLASLTTSTLVDDGLNPDLEIEKTVDALMEVAGNTLEYTIVLANTGDETAMDAVLMDPVPAELMVDVASITGGAMYNEATGMISWTGDLDPGESHTVTFQATISEDAPDNLALINPAMADAMNYYGPQAFDSALTEIRGLMKMFMPWIGK